MNSTVKQFPYFRTDIREALTRLANVPGFDDPNWPAAASDFLRRCGPLRPHSDNPTLEKEEVPEFARRFRDAWNAKTEFDVQIVNRQLEEIFEAGDPEKGERPVVRANFATGEWEPVARTLLDALAIELMRSRKMLHRCERPECGNYFVKQHSRDRYCGLRVRPTCGEVMRERGQRDWATAHRDQLNRKRRKPTTQTKKRRNK
jgi:hypothetical protein